MANHVETVTPLVDFRPKFSQTRTLIDLEELLVMVIVAGAYEWAHPALVQSVGWQSYVT